MDSVEKYKNKIIQNKMGNACFKSCNKQTIVLKKVELKTIDSSFPKEGGIIVTFFLSEIS